MDTFEHIKVMVKCVNDLALIVYEYGEDFVYLPEHREHTSGTCWYVKDGQPDCLIAKFLFKRGWTIEELRTCENTSVYSASANYPGRLTNHEVEILSVAQNAQDKGKTWGKCLTVAKEQFFNRVKQLLSL